jgi:hypothetical protein
MKSTTLFHYNVFPYSVTYFINMLQESNEYIWSIEKFVCLVVLKFLINAINDLVQLYTKTQLTYFQNIQSEIKNMLYAHWLEI